MAVELRRMQQLRDTAADWTSNNPTLLSGEIGIETDTGKFKIGPGAWNSLSYHASAWSDVTGKPSEFTPADHSAAKITSGTVATARLGSGTANSSTYLRGDQTWATVSGGSGTDRGYMFDVRDYGALLGSTNGTTNTAAFQAAVDAAAVQSGGWGSGIVYIPATEIQHDTMYDLETPVWVWGNQITIQGEGKRATMIRGKAGPAFVLAKHPRRWHVSKTTYSNTDAGGATVNTTGTVSSETQLINLERYKPDLYSFRTGGTWGPGSQPEFAPSTVAGLGFYFALRSRGGVVEGRYPYHPFATGDVAQSTISCTSWPEHDKVTWEFVVHHHESLLNGGIAGCGGPATPDPWYLYGTGGDYIMDLALTDADGIRRAWIRVRFAQASGVGVHRITFQFDPNNSDSTKRFSAFVDRVRVATTTENMHHYITYGAFYHLNSDPPSTSDLDGLWTVWNRIARWRESDFGVFTESSRIGFNSGEVVGTRTDYSLLTMAIHTEILYDVGSVGSSQQKIGASGAADDSTVWAMTSGNESRTKALGWVTNTFDWSPDADTNLNVNLRGMSRGRLSVWGYICPKGNLWDATKNNAFKGLAIRKGDSSAVSCGLLLGPFLEMFELEDLDPANAGYFASIGSMFTYVSYYLKAKSIRVNKMIHLTHMTSDFENVEFGYPWRCAVRLTGSEFRLNNFQYPGLTAQHEAFLVFTAGSSLGGEVLIQNGTINSEEKHFQAWGPIFQFERMPESPANGFTLRNVQLGTFGSGVVRVDDYAGGYGSRDFIVNIDKVKALSANPIFTTVGPAATGEVGVGPGQYMTELVSYESAKAGRNFCQVKTIDREWFGVPPSGGFLHDCHEVRVAKPAEGAVAVWKAWNPSSPTATSWMGGSNPPDWLPVEMNDTNRIQHALSGNIHPSFQAAVTLPWPTASNTTVQFSGMAKPFTRLALGTILANGTAPNRSHISLRWGYSSVFHGELTNYPGGFFSVPATTNSGKWAAASSGSKATNTTLTANGIDPDGDPVASWKVYLRRRWNGTIQIGNGSSTTAAWAFQTNVQEPSAWNVTTSDNPVVASGGLILSRVARPGGTWTVYAANQILDWFVDGSLSLGATWHFGLSSTAVSAADGTGITEPGSGAYARVAVTMNGTNWAEHFDSGFYSNAVAIEFPAPTADWGRATHWFISDASSGGNIIACGPLNRAVRVFNGDGRPTFLPGAFQVQL